MAVCSVCLECKLIRDFLVIFLLTGGVGLRSLSQSDKDIEALHGLPDSPKNRKRRLGWRNSIPYRASFSALLFTSWSPESSFLYTGFTPSKPSAGNVSLEGHEDISRFTRPIVSIVLGLEYIPFRAFMEDLACDQHSTSGHDQRR